MYELIICTIVPFWCFSRKLFNRPLHSYISPAHTRISRSLYVELALAKCMMFDTDQTKRIEIFAVCVRYLRQFLIEFRYHKPQSSPPPPPPPILIIITNAESLLPTEWAPPSTSQIVWVCVVLMIGALTKCKHLLCPSARFDFNFWSSDFRRLFSCFPNCDDTICEDGKLIIFNHKYTDFVRVVSWAERAPCDVHVLCSQLQCICKPDHMFEFECFVFAHCFGRLPMPKIIHYVRFGAQHSVYVRV